MQYARPSSDIENPGGWTTEPLWDKIEEEPFDDGDFLTSPKSASGKSFTIGLSGVIDPGVHTGHIVRIRASAKVSGTVKYELMQGAVVIKDSGDVALTVPYAEYNMTLSEAEAAEITDYSTLRVRVTAVKTQKNQYQYVSWMRVDIPDLAGEEHSGTGSISGNGSTTGTIKKGGLGSAIKSAGGTLLALGLAGMLGIASIAGGGSQAVVAKKAIPDTVSISGGGTQIVVGAKSASDTAGISGSGSIIATGVASEVEQRSGIASISGKGDIAGTVTKQAFCDLPITGGGSVIVTGEKHEEGVEEHSGIAVVSGNGVLDVAVIKQALADLAISGNGTVSGTGIKQIFGNMAIKGKGSLIITANGAENGYSGIAIISGGGTIEAVAEKEASGTASISGGGHLIVSEKAVPYIFKVSPRKRIFEVEARERFFKIIPRKRT